VNEIRLEGTISAVLMQGHEYVKIQLRLPPLKEDGRMLRGASTRHVVFDEATTPEEARVIAQEFQNQLNEEQAQSAKRFRYESFRDTFILDYDSYKALGSPPVGKRIIFTLHAVPDDAVIGS